MRRTNGDARPVLRPDFVSENYRVRGWKISAIRALESLKPAWLMTSDGVRQSDLVEKLRHQSTIVELDALSAASKALLIPVLALWLYQLHLATVQREKLQLVIVIEEAHHVLHGQTRAKETAMEMLHDPAARYFAQC
ncbi:MAG: hypothetical protein V3T84_06465 [Phycisphaerales bacterium]